MGSRDRTLGVFFYLVLISGGLFVCFFGAGVCVVEVGGWVVV